MVLMIDGRAYKIIAADRVLECPVPMYLLQT